MLLADVLVKLKPFRGHSLAAYLGSGDDPGESEKVLTRAACR